MTIDIEKKWLGVYAYSPKEEGQWFAAVQAFRKHWEFGIDREWVESDDGWDMVPSGYYFYIQQVKGGNVYKTYSFPRKLRWRHDN